jgi:hypothetical protein
MLIGGFLNMSYDVHGSMSQAVVQCFRHNTDIHCTFLLVSLFHITALGQYIME